MQSEQLRWHIWPTFPLDLFLKISQKMRLYFFYPLIYHGYQLYKADSENPTQKCLHMLIFPSCCLLLLAWYPLGLGLGAKAAVKPGRLTASRPLTPAAQGSHFFFRPPPLGRLLRQRSLRLRGRPGKPRSVSSPPRAKTSMTRWESRKLRKTCPSSENDRSAVGEGRSFAISYV